MISHGLNCLGWLHRQVFVNKNVAVSELQVGMYISDVGNDWIPAKRKKRKGYIRSQSTIDKIVSLGVQEVCIEFPPEEVSEQGSGQADNQEAESSEPAAPTRKPSDKYSSSGIGNIVKINDKIVMNDSKFSEKHKANIEKEAVKKTPKKSTKTPDKTTDLNIAKAGTGAASKGGLIDEIKEKKSSDQDVVSSSPAGGLLDEIKKQKAGDTTSSSKGGLLGEIKANQTQSPQGAPRPAPREGIAQRAKKYLPGAVVVPFSEEFERAKTLHAEAKLRVQEAMQLAKVGKPFDIDGIEDMADGLIDSIVSNRNTLCMMTVLKSQDNYLYEHSVNCSVLMGIFARHMKLSIDIIHDLVTGAILHDIGMIEVPQDIIEKPGKLTPPEEKEMQRHIVVGRKILEKNRGVPAIAFEVCKQHHERLDGQGYMLKIHSHQINQYGRVGAIVDIYDALTSNRSYREAFSPAGAMKKMLELGGGHLDAKLVYQFIQCINIYPVGSLVQLDDSRVGVVHELNVFKKDKPKVRVFYSGKDEQYFDAKTVDLADPNIRVKIKKTVDLDDFEIELEDVI